MTPRDIQAPSSPTTEAAALFLGQPWWSARFYPDAEWLRESVLAIEQQARDEGRREAVREIRERIRSFPRASIKERPTLERFLDRVAGLNASESPPTDLRHDESCCWPDQFRGVPDRDCPGVLALKDMRGDASESVQPEAGS